MALPGLGKVPVCVAKGTSFLDIEQQAQLWMRATKMDPAIRAPFLVLHEHSAPRQVCLSEGGNYLGNRDGVARILEILRNYFAPEAADAIRPQVMRFSQYRCAGEFPGEFVAESISCDGRRNFQDRLRPYSL